MIFGISKTVVTDPFVALTEFSVTNPAAPYRTSALSVAAAIAAGLPTDWSEIKLLIVRGVASETLALGTSYLARSAFELPVERCSRRLNFCSAAPHAAVSATSEGAVGLVSAITREMLLHCPSTVRSPSGSSAVQTYEPESPVEP